MMMRETDMDHEEKAPRKRRWLGRILGLAAVAGAGALWRQRQAQRDLDEELWGDPRDLDDASGSLGVDED
jgi:hypothetical protein